MSLVFIDVEAYGNVPRLGRMTWFGAVMHKTRETFDGLIVPSRASRENPAIPAPDVQWSDEEYWDHARPVMSRFEIWLQRGTGRPIMVSDNPAFDFMWMADALWTATGRCVLGHSARRIADFYAGLVGDFYNTQKWKRLRITPHDHNPVHDAMGNLEAFERLLAGER